MCVYNLIIFALISGKLRKTIEIFFVLSLTKNCTCEILELSGLV